MVHVAGPAPVQQEALEDELEAQCVLARQRRADHGHQHLHGVHRAPGQRRLLRQHGAYAIRADADHAPASSSAPARAVASTEKSSSWCAVLTNQASNCDGGGYTPRASRPRAMAA